MERIKMKDLPPERRPYEKCRQLGAAALSDAELLAVIIRTGSRSENSLKLAERILGQDGPQDGREGLASLLHRSLEEWMKLDGIGLVKGLQLCCIGELSRRIWRRKSQEIRPSFRQPEEIADYYMEEMRHLEQEEVRVMFFDTKQILIRDVLLSKGTVNASLISPREVLIQALRHGAVTMILVHNHPSGDPAPSKEDVALTKRLSQAGSVVGIPLIDHIVIGDLQYLSFREKDLL